MVDGLHIPIWNRTKKPLEIAVIRMTKGLSGRYMGAMWPMYNISLTEFVTMIATFYHEYIPKNNMRPNLK
jgi:hypothetical protein